MFVPGHVDGISFKYNVNSNGPRVYPVGHLWTDKRATD